MNILLSNDDGIEADGLKALAKVLGKEHNVFVCAPLKEQSGMAHALSVHRPMELVVYEDYEKLYKVRAWALDGTPTDCVKMFLESLVNEFSLPQMDLVIAGINHGANLATDVIYSGTVGAAIEGYLHDINSLAVSLDVNSIYNYEEIAFLIKENINKLIAISDSPVLLNINIPIEFSTRPPKFSYGLLGKRDYVNAYIKEDSAGKTFYTVAGEILDTDTELNTDLNIIKNGEISVTPLDTDMTNYALLKNKI